VSCCYWIF